MTVPLFFFRTATLPCPYLEGRQERRLVADISREPGRSLVDHLSASGFRRSQNLAYRPACPGCGGCVPVRLDLGRFAPSRAQRRAIAANSDLQATVVPARATWEQFRLFAAYQRGRHGGGEMSYMGFDDYRSMVEVSPVDTFLVEHRLPDGDLVAAMLLDRQADGLSAVYSFYRPDLAARSLGTFMVLDIARQAIAEGLPYLYLGYWIEGSRKMTYKSRFRPLEGFGPSGWRPLSAGCGDHGGSV